MRNVVLSILVLSGILSPLQSFAQSSEGTLERIAKAGKITLGYREAEPPFSYKTKDGLILGFSIDLCQRIADGVRQHLKLDKLPVEYVLATPATRFIMVKSGKIDLECAATTNNAERRKMVDFSYPDFLTATQFVSRREDGIQTVLDLAGRTVTSASGTVNIDQLNALNKEKGLNIAVLPTKTNEESFELVVSGKASAFVMDGILLAAMIANTEDPSKYVISTEMMSKPEPYGLMLRHGDEAFKTVVNNTLRDIFTGPEIATLYAKWFTSPIPPDGMNLNLPLSSALKEAFANPTEFVD